MTASRNAIDWDQLKPRILEDLENGKTQQQIRQGLAEDPFRVSISKSQLETQLKRWKYRNSLHEPEWKVVSHLINKRRKAGKQTSQVLVNGFIFNERKVAKAMNRYDTPTLAYRLLPPQIPPELSHHLIEVRTPPPSHRSLQLRPPGERMTQARRERLALHLTSSGSVWPRTAQWTKVELSVDQFVARFFLPTYEQDGNFRDVFNMFGRKLPFSRAHRGEETPMTRASCEESLPAQAWDPLKGPHDGVFVNQNEVQRSSSGSHIHTAVVQTLVELLYGLSNQSLGDTGREAMASILETPVWDTVLPRLKDVLEVIDSKIVQAIAEGLLKESIDTCNPSMLDLSLHLGADQTQTIRIYDIRECRHVLSTPLVAICSRYSGNSGQEVGIHSPGKLILSLLRKDPRVSNSDLLWIVSAKCHAIAENLIRTQPERAIDFAIASSDLGTGIQIDLVGFDQVTPLLVACSDQRQSAEKLSFIRCLLERNAKADLKAMLAAAGACDVEVISLLYQHGAPVTGFIPELGSPLSRACNTAARSLGCNTYANAIPLLLRLGASPNSPKDQDLDGWDLSPLHILALSEERPEVTRALSVLLKHGADINHRARLRQLNRFPCYSRSHQPLAETALECTIHGSRWIAAIQFLSADCELTGRELFFISSIKHYHKRAGQARFRQFISALLAKAPEQATAVHWDGLTVLQRAILNEYEDLILALFSFGVSPMPSDFLYMLYNRNKFSAKICLLSKSVQMKLILAARSAEPPITEMSTVRLLLAFACPEAVRHILNGQPDAYDSEGLCHVIARVVSRDRGIYYFNNYELQEEDRHQSDCLTMDDVRVLISRRTVSNRHEDWESTAVVMAARACRADILRILAEPSQECVRSSGLIPLFLLKEILTCSSKTIPPLSTKKDELNSSCLDFWVRYCRMDDPNMRCSPLTAAAMILPESAAEEIVNLLLSQHYEPDSWTVLVATCQGHLSILERLKQLDCWPHILSHEDRPDWCPTALQAAVYSSHLSILRFLLDTGAMVDALDLSASQPFCFAPPLGYVVTSDQTPTILPKTALQHAVDKHNMEMVSLLVMAGANVNAPASMNSGATALQIASIQGSIPMMEYLLSRGADPYAAGAAIHGRTALQGAAEHGRKDAVELLLSETELTDYRHREQLIEAVLYAEKNAQYVVAGILREKLLPPWSLQDEEKLEMLSDDWESSIGHSEFFDMEDEISDWERTFEDIPDSLRAYETTLNPDVTIEQPFIESQLAFQENDSCFHQEMEFGISGHEWLDVSRTSEIDLYDGDVVSGLTLQEDTAAWVEGQSSLEGDGVDDMLLDDLFFRSFS